MQIQGEVMGGVEAPMRAETEVEVQTKVRMSVLVRLRRCGCERGGEQNWVLGHIRHEQ